MEKLAMEDISVKAGKLSARLTGNALHLLADKLVDCFDESGAISYLDISFEHDDTKEVYNLTMTKQSGISQGEVIAQLKAEIEIKNRMLGLSYEAIRACDGDGYNFELDKYLDNLS